MEMYGYWSVIGHGSHEEPVSESEDDDKVRSAVGAMSPDEIRKLQVGDQVNYYTQMARTFIQSGHDVDAARRDGEVVKAADADDIIVIKADGLTRHEHVNHVILTIADDLREGKEMSAEDKKKAREVAEIDDRDDPGLAPAIGQRVNANRKYLLDKYGRDWRKKAGIDESVSEAEELLSEELTVDEVDQKLEDFTKVMMYYLLKAVKEGGYMVEGTVQNATGIHNQPDRILLSCIFEPSGQDEFEVRNFVYSEVVKIYNRLGKGTNTGDTRCMLYRGSGNIGHAGDVYFENYNGYGMITVLTKTHVDVQGLSDLTRVNWPKELRKIDTGLFESVLQISEVEELRRLAGLE
jgi:hypothetical protein